MAREQHADPRVGPTASFGDSLRQLRERASLSQEELAARAGLSAKAIGALERGERRRPHPRTVSLLAQALGVDAAERRRLTEAVMVVAAPSRVSRPTDAPAAVRISASLDAPTHNLPLQLTSFIGREYELAEVRSLLASARLVTLTGAGGCGKTRLACQVAFQVLGDFPDGVWLVELAALTDPGLVSPTIAAVLAVRERPDQPLLTTLTDTLQSRQVLLVLDNCEHLVDACASVVSALLRACPRLRILATSRRPLRVLGEHEFSVDPLPLPTDSPGEWPMASPAILLFVERAGAVRKNFQLTRENAASVVEICRRLDGLPLAIELAAARVRLLAPEALAARLDNRFGLLTEGATDQPPRQQTLRATIAWSYGLLEPAGRKLFARVSVFVGGFDLRAVEAVCSDGTDIVAGLDRLVGQSLVRAGPSGQDVRLQLLETVRAFGLEQLAAEGELEEMRRRHAHHYLERVVEARPRYVGPDERRWMDGLEHDQDNLRAALRWAIDHHEADLAGRLASILGPFWYRRSHLSEGRAWLTAALSTLEGTDLGALLPSCSVDAASWPGNLATTRPRAPMPRKAWPSRARSAIGTFSAWRSPISHLWRASRTIIRLLAGLCKRNS